MKGLWLVGQAIDVPIHILTHFIISTLSRKVCGAKREEEFKIAILKTCQGEMQRRLVKHGWEQSWSEQQLTGAGSLWLCES